jgi:hypothetical protein
MTAREGQRRGFESSVYGAAQHSDTSSAHARSRTTACRPRSGRVGQGTPRPRSAPAVARKLVRKSVDPGVRWQGGGRPAYRAYSGLRQRSQRAPGPPSYVPNLSCRGTSMLLCRPDRNAAPPGMGAASTGVPRNAMSRRARRTSTSTPTAARSAVGPECSAERAGSGPTHGPAIASVSTAPRRVTVRAPPTRRRSWRARPSARRRRSARPTAVMVPSLTGGSGANVEHGITPSRPGGS